MAKIKPGKYTLAGEDNPYWKIAVKTISFS